MEEIAKKFGESTENLELPGKDYYEGCFKKEILENSTNVEPVVDGRPAERVADKVVEEDHA